MPSTYPAIPSQPDSKLGYQFDPLASRDRPGHRRLSVWLRPTPTEYHFDPETVHCPVVSQQQSLETLSIQHPWQEGRLYRTGAGTIQLRDRKSKKVEAFSYGGELRINSDPSVTVCVFESPAPILPLLELDSLAARIAAEVEAIMGQARAQWNNHHSEDDFDQQLAGLDPMTLYIACLESVDAHLRSIHRADMPLHEVLRHVERERQALRDAGQWPLDAEPLLELLERS